MKINNNSKRLSKTFLTAKEAAKILRVGVPTIKNYIYQGKIKSFKTPGGHHRIPRSELLPQLKDNFIDKIKNGADEITNNNLAKLDSLFQVYASTIKGFWRTLSERDVFTKGHSERVANYSLSIGDKFNLPPQEKKNLELAALLHDVGKLSISAQILGKPGPLTAEEFAIVKRHPEMGEDMVKDIDFLNNTLPLIRHHHERYDGAGYPDQLKGEEIPLGARIIFVAETYDMLTSDLSYRPAQSSQKAIEELKRVAGKQLDQDIVSTFIVTFKKIACGNNLNL